jgi:hypothetical protein
MLKLAKLSEIFRNWRQKTSGNIKDTISLGYVKIFIVLLVITNLSLWLSAKYFVDKIAADKVALHYNVDFGIDYYGDINQIYIIPALGLIIFFINALIAFLVNRRKDAKFLRSILFLSALSVNIILAVALFSIYLINTK